MEELQKALHQLRKDLHAILVRLDKLKENQASAVAGRNIAIAITHTEDARMRLGKALEDTGSELPAQFADKSDAAKQEEPAAPIQPVAPTTPSQPGNFSQEAQQQVQGQPAGGVQTDASANPGKPTQ